MTNTAGRLLAVSLVSLIGLAMLTTGGGFVGTAAAAGNTAPDCSTVSYAGSGTSSDPYEVGNVDQLQCIENQGLGNHYELTSDIDASGTDQWNAGAGFAPIGESGSEFTGKLDGGEQNITDLYTNVTASGENAGLFGATDGATISNLSLVNADISAGDGTDGTDGSDTRDSNGESGTDGTDGGDAAGLVVIASNTVVHNVTVSESSVAAGDGGRGGDGGDSVFERGGHGGDGGDGGNASVIATLSSDSVVRHTTVSTSDVTAGDGGNAGHGGRHISGGGTKPGGDGGDGGVGGTSGGLVGVDTRGTVRYSYVTDLTVTTGDGGNGGSGGKSEWLGTRGADGADASGGYGGGLIGDNDGTVESAYVGSVTLPTPLRGSLGGVAGNSTRSDSYSNVYWDVGETGQASGVGDGSASGLTGFGSTGDTAPAHEMTGINATVRMTDFDFGSTWRPGDGDDQYPDLALDSSFAGSAEAFNSLVVGNGSSGSPYQIEHVYDLQAIRERVGNGDHFQLQNDIDASGTSSWNGGSGFDPIGDSGTPFTGTFDGNGHTISGLYIDRGSNVGLFGVVSGGTVENVGVENVDINGSEYVGGLVGRNNAAVTKSYATGDVNGTKFVGGLIGENLEDVTESYATGNVNATRNVGGLVGRNNANVTESYATGDVSGNKNSVGGLVGQNYGNLTKSYATGDVNGTKFVGGLVGFNDVDAGSNGYVANAYATGDVSGTQDAGGLVGLNPGGTVEDAYWDVNTTGQSSSAGSPDANGLSTVEMQRFAPQVTMDGFSFESPETWLVTGGYPALAWEPVTELTVDTVEATSPTVAEDESGTITVTANESGTDASEGVTIEVVNNDSLDGFSTGDTKVTDAKGKVEFTFGGPTDGSYSPEFAWADNTSVSDTATVTVRDAPEGGGSSGGSSGSTDTGGDQSTADDSSVGTETVVSGTRSDDGSISFTINASDDDGPITLDLSATDADGTDDEDESGGNDDSEGEGENTVSVDSLSVTPTESGSRKFDISVRVWDTNTDTNERATESDDTGTDTTDVSDPQGATDGDRASTDPRTFLIETGLSPLGYVEVTHTNPDSDIDSVTFRFRIRKDALNQSNVDPSGVALYRNGTDGWTRLPTDEVGENSTHYVFEGTSPGLSLFTIASAQPAFEVIRASSRSETLTTSEAVTVNATVRNLGGAAGTYTAELRANGTVVATSDVDLASNSSRTVSLSFTPSDPGEYTLTVGTVSAGAVSVQSDETPAESTSADQTLTEPTPAEQETTQQATVATDNSSQTASANGTRETTTDASGPGFGVLVLIGAFLIVIVFFRRRS